MEEIFFVIQRTPLFHGIHPEDIPAMLSCLGAQTHRVPKGGAVLRAGEPAGAVGVVLLGRVQVCQEDMDGVRSILTSVGEGGLFAEAYACARQAQLPVSVWAQEESQILLLDVGRVVSTCPSACAFHTRLIENLLSILAEKNLLLSEKIDCIGKRSLSDKLLTYLEYEALRAGSDSFTIPFDRQALADYLCADRSALSRVIGMLRRTGVLEVRRNQFTLLR